MGYLLEFYAVQALVAILELVPLSLSGWMVKRVADVFFLCSPRRRAIVADNLTIAYGESLTPREKKTIARHSVENQALSILELFIIKKIKKGAASRFTMLGRQYFDQALAAGKGIVFVASHLGSWEYIGFPGYLMRFPHSVIVKKVKNPYLDKIIDGLRREADTVPIPKEASALRQTLAELRQNHGVAIIIDQWAGDEGLWIDFFGKATSTTSLPARLANKTGCALVPIYCLRKKIGQYEIHMLPAVPVPEGPAGEASTTKRLNEILESQIRKYPDQWSWSHRRWKPKPSTAALHPKALVG